MKIDQPIVISKMAFKLFELYGEPSSKAKYNTEAIVNRYREGLSSIE